MPTTDSYVVALPLAPAMGRTRKCERAMPGICRVQVVGRSGYSEVDLNCDELRPEC